MNNTVPSILQQPKAVAVFLLVVASMALTLGFACAVPFAAFAAISAMLMPGMAAFGAILSVWLANQIVGFVGLNYPTDASTVAWGLALGLISVGCVGVAHAVLARFRGFLGAGFALLSAFVVYEGAIYVVCLTSGTDVSDFTYAVVTRIFLINAATFVGLLALWAVVRRTETGRRFDALLGLRHA